jgi:hypothetical protein
MHTHRRKGTPRRIVQHGCENLGVGMQRRETGALHMAELGFIARGTTGALPIVRAAHVP